MKLSIVAKREYLTRVRTKGFIIGTLLGPLLLLGLGLGPALVMSIETEKTERLAVIDLSGVVYTDLASLAGDFLGAGVRLQRLHDVSEMDLPALQQALAQQIDQDELDGYILIPADVLQANQAQFYARNVSDMRRRRQMEQLLSQAVRRVRVTQSGLDEELVRSLTQGVKLGIFRVGPEGSQADTGEMFLLPFLLGMLLYTTLILYGTFVMRSVIEEKSSRVVEIVVSSLRPFDLMAGKILGVGAVGLTQLVIWLGALALLSAYGATLASNLWNFSGDLPIPSIPLSIFFYLGLFFLLGYFLFSTMYAGVGALVNSEQEAQGIQFPIVLLLIIPFMLMFFVISNPNTGISMVLSLVPFFTPILMFTRIVVQAPAWWEIAASIAGLVLAIMGMTWLVSKIYRIGILMYGKRPTLTELLKWLRYS